MWRRLGSEVTLFEPYPTFLAMADTQIAAEAWKLFTDAGVPFLPTPARGAKAAATHAKVAENRRRRVSSQRR